VKQLLKRIPELKGISPAADQQALAMILQKSGARVDEFFVTMVDLVAHEEIKQERLGTFGVAGGSESIRDNYLVLRRGDGTRVDFDEFRMDEKRSAFGPSWSNEWVSCDLGIRLGLCAFLNGASAGFEVPLSW
jgi:hypothetical protein